MTFRPRLVQCNTLFGGFHGRFRLGSTSNLQSTRHDVAQKELLFRGRTFQVGSQGLFVGIQGCFVVAALKVTAAAFFPSHP
jgi:hypothetical protein